MLGNADIVGGRYGFGNRGAVQNGCYFRRHGVYALLRGVRSVISAWAVAELRKFRINSDSLASLIISVYLYYM